ncbi:AMP-binding protein [Rhodococcus jostii]|uniref:AMP-binding protein n=1 Tax=Rhodococcus jostii TaxID=132919 RepID=A0ABU4C6L2_RHOJO|nr:AMP-binding protein [Rhodococcus jostii]MDV6279180.1 AMP-binding protein [Rhodococcus jostii]
MTNAQSAIHKAHRTTTHAAAGAPIPPYWVTQDLSSRAKIKQYEQTPLPERGLPTSVYEFIRTGAMIDPEAIAFTYLPDVRDLTTAEHLTHRQVLRRITQATNLFHALGVRADDPVSILTANTPEPQFALWGAQTAGIANPLNWMLEPELLGELITATGSKILVSFGGDATTDVWPKLEAILAHAPTVETVIRAGGSRSGPVPAGVRFLDLVDELDQHPGDELIEPRRIEWDTVGAIFGTGGTTGTPKLARVTHGGQIYASWASAVAHRVPVGSVRFCASPTFHVHGIAVTQLTGLALGGTGIFPTSGGWRGPGVIDNFWPMVQRFSVTSVPLLPTIANRLVQRPADIPAHHTLDRVTSGSAPLSMEVADRFRALTGVSIAEGYGLTETSGAVVGCPRGVQPRPGIIGMPVPYTDAKIVQQNTNGTYTECGTGEPGILLLRTPGLFAGYLDARQNDGVVLADGWLNTGDLACIDSDGFLRITGRAKDVIIRGGHNIDPAPVEEALFEHPRVAEASVVAMPDPDAGEVPVAYVVVTDGAPLDVEDLASHLRTRVRERAAQPKQFFVLDELPKSPVGKILKNRLRVDAVERAFTRLLDVAELHGRYELHSQDQGAAGIDVVVRLRGDDPAMLDRARNALSSVTVRHRVHSATR